MLAMPSCKVLILSIALVSFYTELYISSVVAEHCRRPVEILHTGPALHRRVNYSFLFKSACSFNGTVCILYCYLLQGCCIAVAKEKKKKKHMVVHVVHLLLLSRNQKRHCYISEGNQQEMISYDCAVAAVVYCIMLV